MPLPSIILLDASTMDRGDLDFGILRRLGEVTLHEQSVSSEISKRISKADIVLTNKAAIDSKTLAKAKKLRMIAICATGTNNVDLIAAKKHKIYVANVAGYGTPAVAQHTLTFMLNWATQMYRYVSEPKAWSKSRIFTRLDYPVVELDGKNLGLVGTGRIGNEVGRLASAFGMNVRAWAREAPQAGVYGASGNLAEPRRSSIAKAGEGATQKDNLWPRLPIRKLFETSDIISLHCPLTDQTRHIINSESLAWMKKGAFLINTGRGDLVDEKALIEALRSGHLSGAGLDVLSSEPPHPKHPLINLNHPNLMITPHSAWSSHEARTRLLHEVAANIEAFLNGKDRNRVA